MGVVPDHLQFWAFRIVHAQFKPHWRLRAAYWRIRASRWPRQSRLWYRVVRAEKSRLAAAGVDPEALRLYCLYLADPDRSERLLKCAQYLAQGRLDL